MEMKFRNKIQALVMTGVFAALLAVMSQISIPLPTGVPLTLQTFAMALCGYVLGAKLGTLAVAVFLALGAVGLPVYAGFSSGIAALAGLTGGFLWGFLLIALFAGLGLKKQNPVFHLGGGMIGLILCHVLGVLQYALVAPSTFFQSFLLVSMPYLLKDVLSVAAAYFVAKAIVLSLKKAGLAWNK